MGRKVSFPIYIKLTIRSGKTEKALGFMIMKQMPMHQIDRLFNALIKSTKVLLRTLYASY